jgi:ABC-2 type transport system permease protein
MRLYGIVWKEFVQLRRDAMALTLMLFIPVALLFIFGYAINTDVKHLPTVVFDQSRDLEAQKLLEAFRNSHTDLATAAPRPGRGLVDTGRAKVGRSARLRGPPGAAGASVR